MAIQNINTPVTSVKTDEGSEAIIRASFGQHPEDVISPVKTAADVFSWLEEIFASIRREAEGERVNTTRIRNLADCGVYVAAEFTNYLGVEHEGMSRSLASAGLLDDGKTPIGKITA